MSWFDATGIASLAKSALKEAQKTIDKALDIKEDELDDSLTNSTTAESKSNDSVDANILRKPMKQSISNPILSTVGSAAAANNIWGSFTGSFFDTSAKDESSTAAVTIAPTSSNTDVVSTKISLSDSNRMANEIVTSGSASVGSASESVEVLSSPSSIVTSPSMSNVPLSSSCSAIQQTPSESIEIIAYANDTPISSELLSPISMPSPIDIVTSASFTSISESVEVIDEQSVPSIDEPKQPISSSSVEQIQLFDEEDDSISESTAPLTIMDSTTQQKLPITVPPCRSSLHLPLSQPSTSQLHLPIVNEIAIETKTPDKRSPSYTERSLESFEAQTQLSDSTQSFEDVQQILLDEASILKINRTLDTGSASADTTDKNYVIKASTAANTSEQNSGHTSADEVETATSSDIEIISGPNGNGDSSSTHSATGIVCLKASPHKGSTGQMASHSQYVICSKRKGHCRELSEASTYSLQSESGSDSYSQSASEIEKLLHRISELSEVLEARESKLVELGRDNAELREKNTDLKAQIDGLRCRPDTSEMNTIAEEYAQRMSALEKKFQQTLRERDALRGQLKTTQSNLSTSTSKNDFDAIVKEKDFMINELKTEGEKLSKQILQHSNIIKKLRAKEKDTDATIKRQTEHIEELTSETERLKKSLSAKDEVERTQMEAVHKLSSEKRKLVKELTQAKSELEDAAQKLKSLQISFDAAKKEVTEKQQDHSSLTRKAKDLVNLQGDHQILLVQNQQMATELESLREKLRSDSYTQSVQQQKLRQENNLLVRKLEEIEQRSEENANAISVATIPLVRQCEALQTTLNDRTITWEKQEIALMRKIESLEKQLQNVSLVEKNANEHTAQLNARLQSLEESLSKALLRSEQSNIQLQQNQVELDILQSEYRKTKTCAEEKERKYDETIADLQRRLDESAKELNDRLQKESPDEQTRREAAMQTSIRSVHEQRQQPEKLPADHIDEDKMKDSLRSDNNSSPTLSLGQLSQPDSLASHLWPLEDIDCISNTGRPSLGNSSLYGNGHFAIGGTTIIETLQATLKQKDGENHQLQWELSRLQSERNFLLAEVSSLNVQLENLKEKLTNHETISADFTKLQEEYDAILQMYGEKVEENDELQLDLQDVKDMYRAQIDDLLVQQRQMQQKILNYQKQSEQK